MILLIPHPTYADALLKEGPCGSRPPVANRHIHKDGGECWDPTCKRAFLAFEFPTRALVLAHEGQPVPEGCDRAKAVLATTTPPDALRGLPLMALVHGGGGLTFGRYNATKWTLMDCRGSEWEFEIADVGTEPLAYPLALATVCAARGLGEIVTESSR